MVNHDNTTCTQIGGQNFPNKRRQASNQPKWFEMVKDTSKIVWLCVARVFINERYKSAKNVQFFFYT